MNAAPVVVVDDEPQREDQVDQRRRRYALLKWIYRIAHCRVLCIWRKGVIRQYRIGCPEEWN